MGLFDFLKSKKRKKKEAAGKTAEETMRLDGVDLSGVEPTETRYTQEYQDYLAAQKAAEKSEEPAVKEYPAASPEGFCARFDRCSASLIEEPESCEVCKSFCDSDATCRWPEQAQ